MQLQLQFQKQDPLHSLVSMYTNAQRRHPKALVICLHEGHYVALMDDATTMAQKLKLTVAHRTYNDQTLAYSSFPSDQLPDNLPKLIRMGLRVAVASLDPHYHPEAYV